MKTRLVLFGVLALFLLSSCGKNRLDVDVSSVKVAPVKLRHFEKAVFSIDTNNVAAGREKLAKEYGSFYTGYMERYLCYNISLTSPSCNDSVLQFVHNELWLTAHEHAQKALGDVSDLEKELEGACQHFKYHFPDKQLPSSVNIMMSGFSNNVKRLGNDYGISEEMYMGPGDEIYDLAREWMPEYKRRRCKRENIVPDLVREWTHTEFPYNMNKTDFLSQLVFEGKQWYLLDAMLRDTPDTVKFLFTAKQLQWCEDNEANIWATFIKEKYLYGTSEQVNKTYLGDGNFTTSFDHASPSRTGCWIGYRIVKKYMDDHPNVTLPQLMAMTDAQVLQTQAQYKPKF